MPTNPESAPESFLIVQIGCRNISVHVEEESSIRWRKNAGIVLESRCIYIYDAE